MRGGERAARALGFAVIWCLALGLVQGAAAEPPAPGPNRTGAQNAGSAHGAAANPNRAGKSTTASAPQITTDAAYATGATTAIVTGNGDPEGQPTRLHAGYAPSGARWCTSHGDQGKSARTRPQKLGSGYEMISELSVTLEGLTAGTEYCVELVATNSSGTTHGGQVRFTTSAPSTQGGAQASSIPPRPPRSPPAPSIRVAASSSWPTAAVVVVVALGAALLGGMLAVTRARLRSRRRDSARPISS